MNVTIIGSGNVATVLGRLIKSKGHSIDCVISRNLLAARELANEFDAKYEALIEGNKISSDLFLIAVADKAIEEVANTIRVEKGMVVHTSGSVGMRVLENSSRDFGVLYPLQSLRKELTYLPQIPFLADANNEANLIALKTFAESLSSCVAVADDETRLKLHVAAVITSNFSNHLYALAKDYCDKENIPFSMLVPLILEVADRLQFFSPRAMQTGPAVRGDFATIEKHLEILAEYPALKNMYAAITKSIEDYHR